MSHSFTFWGQTYMNNSFLIATLLIRVWTKGYTHSEKAKCIIHEYYIEMHLIKTCVDVRWSDATILTKKIVFNGSFDSFVLVFFWLRCCWCISFACDLFFFTAFKSKWTITIKERKKNRKNERTKEQRRKIALKLHTFRCNNKNNAVLWASIGVASMCIVQCTLHTHGHATVKRAYRNVYLFYFFAHFFGNSLSEMLMRMNMNTLKSMKHSHTYSELKKKTTAHSKL